MTIDPGNQQERQPSSHRLNELRALPNAPPCVKLIPDRLRLLPDLLSRHDGVRPEQLGAMDDRNEPPSRDGNSRDRRRSFAHGFFPLDKVDRSGEWGEHY